MRPSNYWDKEEKRQDIYAFQDQSEGYYQYIQNELRKPENKRIKIGLDKIIRSLASIQNSWKKTKRELSLIELVNSISMEHEIEIATEKINDFIIREYVYSQLDDISSIRRSISEEIKWEIASNRK